MAEEREPVVVAEAFAAEGFAAIDCSDPEAADEQATITFRVP